MWTWPGRSRRCRFPSASTSRTATATTRPKSPTTSPGWPTWGWRVSTSRTARRNKLIDPKVHAAKVAAVKERTPGLFVNARTDTYWLGTDANTGATLARAAAYAQAGADGVFVPGATDPAVLRELAAHIPLPVNVLAVPALGAGALADLGIRRISTGSLPYRAALHAAVRTATTVRDDAGQPPEATAYPELQARLVRYDQSTR